MSLTPDESSDVAMMFLDLTLPSPAENLACDEALLDAAESGEADEALRFWESRDYFVVVGYACKVEAEVNLEACGTCNVPVLRRCSGGGTIVQGPGCLNYALILCIAEERPTRSIGAANAFIMERNRTAVSSAIRDDSSFQQDPRPEVRVQGHTDLTLNGLKFSGNSQRRRRNFLLFHGTFLLNFDLGRIGEVLRFPSRQPAYRRGRAHAAFLTNLGVNRENIVNQMSKAWRAQPFQQPGLDKRINALITEKYNNRDWVQRL